MKFLFDQTFSTHPADRRKIVSAFFYAFFTAGAYVVGRSAADALFLARVGPSWLPLMYLISACSLGLMSVVFANIAARTSLKRLVTITLVVLASSSIVLCQVVQRFDHALVLLATIYLLAELRGCLNTIQYGILMNELFAGSANHHHAAGLLSAAATLAGIVFGVVVAFEVHQLGTVHLLYMVAGLELLALIPIALLPRIETRNTNGGDWETAGDREAGARLAVLPLQAYAPATFTSRLRTAAQSPYVRGVAMLVAVTVMVGTLVEYQWKSTVAVSFATKEDQMTSFFGLFHAAVDLMTGLIQVLLTGRLLHHFGTRTALLIFPTALFASTLGVLFAAADRVVLSAITLAKGCDVVKRSVNDPAILMLYAPLSNGPRRQAITFVGGIVKPSAEAVAALLIISFAGIIGTRAISYVALALLCVWLFVALWRRTENGNLASPFSSDSNTEQG